MAAADAATAPAVGHCMVARGELSAGLRVQRGMGVSDSRSSAWYRWYNIRSRIRSVFWRRFPMIENKQAWLPMS